MSRKFSEEDIRKIKTNLQNVCEESWKVRGYKQTNIPLLTGKVGISSGAFYIVYKSKEDLFVEVLEKVQKNLIDTWIMFVNENESKIEGFKLGLQWVFHEFQKYPKLYNFNNPDYELFLAKLPNEKIEIVKKNSQSIFSKTVQDSGLKLLLPEEEVIRILNSILVLGLMDANTNEGNDNTFNFLLDHSIYNLFEEG